MILSLQNRVLIIPSKFSRVIQSTEEVFQHLQTKRDVYQIENCPIGQELLCIIIVELKVLRNPRIIQILCKCFFYHSIVSIATWSLDCVYATLKTQSAILSNLFKVKYYVISQGNVLSL